VGQVLCWIDHGDLADLNLVLRNPTMDREWAYKGSITRMKQLQFIWPEGKAGALTTSWDDGTIHDRKLVSILNQYGILGTWNLNSGGLGMDNAGTGWMDMIPVQDVNKLYAGHEVACHSVNHPNLASLSQNLILAELINDRQALERLVQTPVLGLAYPFGCTNETVRTTTRNCGLVYGRGVAETRKFDLPDDFLDWSPSFHFDESYRKMWYEFTAASWEGKLLYIWGHSFEFEPGKWNQIEDFCRLAGNHSDLWYATNIQIYEYITAWRSLSCTVDLSHIKNNSFRHVWFRIDGKLLSILPGEICSTCSSS
jgi:peptidoglycan-N-acetylglucosamine deacetylase